MGADSVTTVTIDFWQLILAIGAMVAFIGGLMMVAGKLLLTQLDSRLVERDATLAKLTEKLDEVERDVLRLRADLPNEYVRREDWIRLSSLIDTKLDWLRDKQETMRETVAQLTERLSSFIGGNR